ncbi:hypothetical protein D3C74_168230 [compost metagenome]
MASTKNNNNKSKTTSASKKNCKSKNGSSVPDLFQGKNMEIIVAALLVTGKLRVDAVQLFRQATMIVSLTGKYKTLANMNNSNVSNMVKFLNENGDMTLDEVIQAFKSKM